MTVSHSSYIYGNSSDESGSGSLISSSSGSGTDDENQRCQKTVYERIKAIYTRDSKSILSTRTYAWQSPQWLEEKVLDSNWVEYESDLFVKKLDAGYTAFECERSNGTRVGVVIVDLDDCSDFDFWFLRLLARTTKAQHPSQCNTDTFKDLTNEITALFETELKNKTRDDQWEVSGQAYFKSNVDYFTLRNVPIEAVLPAFPHKSSNLDKVSSPMPDKGEELALRRLLSFAALVKEIYPPGVRIWIVSDGHVFSDCGTYSFTHGDALIFTNTFAVGVDDGMVNEYFSKLHDLYLKVKPLDLDPIQFHSLVDIFSLKNTSFDKSMVDEVMLHHYLDTEIDAELELCRKILEASCDTDYGSLKRDIHTPNHPRLFLYRGFAKFMEEDLAMHPIAKGSRKKFKKTVSKIAFEMIKVCFLFIYCLSVSY